MEPVVKYVLDRRAAPGARSGLRRGLSTATEHYAYPYLAVWWKDRPYLKAPLLVFGGLAGTFPNVGFAERVTVGVYAASLVREGQSEASVERKLIALQTASLDRYAVVIRQLLASGPKAIDWNDLWWTVLMWEHPDLAKRTRTRRRILEDFYQNLTPAETNTKETSS